MARFPRGVLSAAPCCGGGVIIADGGVIRGAANGRADRSTSTAEVDMGEASGTVGFGRPLGVLSFDAGFDSVAVSSRAGVETGDGDSAIGVARGAVRTLSPEPGERGGGYLPGFAALRKALRSCGKRALGEAVADGDWLGTTAAPGGSVALGVTVAAGEGEAEALSVAVGVGDAVGDFADIGLAAAPNFGDAVAVGEGAIVVLLAGV